MNQFEYLQELALLNDSHGYLTYFIDNRPTVMTLNITFSNSLGKPIATINKGSKAHKQMLKNDHVSFFFGNQEEIWAEVSGTATFLPYIAQNFQVFVEARKKNDALLKYDDAMVVLVLTGAKLKIGENGRIREQSLT